MRTPWKQSECHVTPSPATYATTSAEQRARGVTKELDTTRKPSVPNSVTASASRSRYATTKKKKKQAGKARSTTPSFTAHMRSWSRSETLRSTAPKPPTTFLSPHAHGCMFLAGSGTRKSAHKSCLHHEQSVQEFNVHACVAFVTTLSASFLISHMANQLTRCSRTSRHAALQLRQHGLRKQKVSSSTYSEAAQKSLICIVQRGMEIVFHPPQDAFASAVSGQRHCSRGPIRQGIVFSSSSMSYSRLARCCHCVGTCAAVPLCKKKEILGKRVMARAACALADAKSVLCDASERECPLRNPVLPKCPDEKADSKRYNKHTTFRAPRVVFKISRHKRKPSRNGVSMLICVRSWLKLFLSTRGSRDCSMSRNKVLCFEQARLVCDDTSISAVSTSANLVHNTKCSVYITCLSYTCVIVLAPTTSNFPHVCREDFDS